MTVLGVTGHRPQKMYGFKENDPRNIWVIHAIERYLKKTKPSKLNTGMALGVDQWAAQWAMAMGIPFVAMLPVESPEKAWPESSQKKYHHIMKHASEVVVVPPESSDNYAALLQKRNELIVDNSDIMLGVFGGTSGGTCNCLEYAVKQEKWIDIINPGDYYQSTESQ